MKRRKLLDTFLTTANQKILILGCGNSQLSADMYNNGYKNIVNIDVSHVVIQQMQLKHVDLVDMRWICMDAKALEFPDSSFDLVLDKGTVDAISCSARSFADINQVNKEVSRVLKPGGYFVVISYGCPEMRLQHFDRPAVYRWTTKCSSFRLDSESCDSSPYYMYECQKATTTSAPLLAEETIDGLDDDQPRFHFNPTYKKA